ncbi:THO complex subunit 7 homolog [Zophobas morio]|uniref:THO complex subunit 7 homolog n=1 Tax=Zophobas morio TaxID=2755281 RepID=UPI003082B608
MSLSSEVNILKERFFEEDRRFHIIVRLFQEFIASNSEERDEIYVKLLSSIPELVFSVRKQDLMRKMHIRELQDLESYDALLVDEISAVKKEIYVLSDDLKKARQKRANRVQYDMMLSAVNEYPSREETTQKISQIQEKLTSLKHQKKDIDKKFSERRKQFHTILASSTDLEKNLLSNQAEEELEVSAEIREGQEQCVTQDHDVMHVEL